MKLTEADSRSRLAAADHGVLCTLHQRRGVDAVPVVFALGEDDHLAVPVDVVKPKTSTRLQRRRNLETDDRATLLVEHWDPADWSRLWWVRAELRWLDAPSAAVVESLSARLVDGYEQYRHRPFADVLVFGIVGLTGWSAAG
ncbi:MAG: hypothetical protein AAF962_12690 [Actinomycetota bacterium]